MRHRPGSELSALLCLRLNSSEGADQRGSDGALSGLLALLDDVVALTKATAATRDDVAGQAARAATRPLGHRRCCGQATLS